MAQKKKSLTIGLNIFGLMSNQTFEHVFPDLFEVIEHQLLSYVALTGKNSVEDFPVFLGTFDKVLIRNQLVHTFAMDAVSGLYYQLSQQLIGASPT